MDKFVVSMMYFILFLFLNYIFELNNYVKHIFDLLPF